MSKTVVSIIVFMILPVSVFAQWWNPFTWREYFVPTPTKQLNLIQNAIEVSQDKSTLTNSTSTLPSTTKKVVQPKINSAKLPPPLENRLFNKNYKGGLPSSSEILVKNVQTEVSSQGLETDSLLRVTRCQVSAKAEVTNTKNMLLSIAKNKFEKEIIDAKSQMWVAMDTFTKNPTLSPFKTPESVIWYYGDVERNLLKQWKEYKEKVSGDTELLYNKQYLDCINKI